MIPAALALLAHGLSSAALAQEAPAEAPAAATSGPITYTLSPAKSTLSVLVKYDRDALVAGHDHIVQASTFDGTVTWDPEDPGACNIQISFPVTALVVDPPGARSRAGLEGSTSDGDKKKIKENIEGKHQLEASKFPKISFTGTECVARGDRFNVTGPLQIHGVGHEVTVSMKIDASADSFAAKGSFNASHGDWGFDPYTALFGSLRNDETLGFTIDVQGAPK